MLGVICAAHGFHIGFEIRVHRHADHLHAQVMGGFQESRVDGHRGDHFGVLDALLGPAPFAVDVHGVVDALRAAGGDRAGDLVVAIQLGDFVPVQHLAHHRQHFAFELGAAGAQVALQQVDVGKLAEDFVQEFVMLQPAVVHGARALAFQPFLVLFVGHIFDFAQHLGLVQPFFGQALVDGEELVVGVHIAE